MATRKLNATAVNRLRIVISHQTSIIEQLELVPGALAIETAAIWTYQRDGMQAALRSYLLLEQVKQSRIEQPDPSIDSAKRTAYYQGVNLAIDIITNA
jgi:hypothetical protein